MGRRLLLICTVTAAGLLTAANGASAALPKSLVGWWKLDDGAGTTAQDASGNNRNGTLVGGPVWTTGRIDGGLQFDGTDDFVRVPDDPALTFANTQSYTLAAWIHVPEVIVGWHGIVTKGRQSGGGASYYGIWIGDNSGVATWYYGTWPTWGSPVPGPGWYHIVVTQDGAGNTKKLYINGEFDSQTGAQAGNAAGAMVFGSDQEPGDSFKGTIDDVQLYDKAVSEEQVVGIVKGVMPSWLKAERPEPADGAAGVTSPLLRWTAGETAVQHNVYLGTSPELTEADLVSARTPLALYWHIPGIEPGVTYYWRVDEIEADGATIYSGDVWSFTAQALMAYLPDPADGATDVSVSPVLAWQPGQAAAEHQVYFDDSLDAVTQGAADADKGKVEETTFAPGTLESLTTYYWRVDETKADGTVKAGPIWSFTTCLPIDDFESYTDDEGSRIYETWIDGFTNGNSGSTVGYIEAPFAEQKIVHGGAQSMPLDYNNLDAPYYSEAERTWAAAQDWTAGGVEALVMYVRGRAGNAPDKLYVAVKDKAGRMAMVVNTDPEAVLVGKWTAWKIPLASFTDVNTVAVKTLYLGVGDRDHPVAGGIGLIHIDDIRLTRP